MPDGPSKPEHNPSPHNLNQVREDFNFSNIQAFLVIGVTGHRDIPGRAHEDLQRMVRDILLEQRRKYPNTPLVLLTPLAEGADRLCAYAALSEEVQIPFMVPMPMPKGLYEQDFGRDSLAEFRALLNCARGWIELPLVGGNTIEGIASRGPQRDLQYESVGKYIAQKSQILIALWDGVETDLTGGTTSVVQFQREGVPPSQPCTLEPPEGFPVYHIRTPRDSNPEPKGVPFCWLYPRAFGSDDKEAKNYFDRMFSRINDFNKCVSTPDEALRDESAKSKRDFLPDIKEQELPEMCRTELERYGVVDALAIRFQRGRIRTQKYLHWMIFLSFLSLVLFAHLPPHRPEFLALSLCFLLLAFIRSRAVKRKDEDTKYEDYRSLAEGLRVEFFWRLIGLSDSVADYYLWKQRTELDWMRNVFRAWSVRTQCAQPNPATDDLRKLLARVRDLWVEQQRQYFADARRREEERLAELERISHNAIRLAIATGGVLLIALLVRFVPELLRHGNWRSCECAWVDPFLIVIETALAAGALVHHYRDRLAHAEHVKQYARMARVLSRASESLGQLQKNKDINAMLSCLKKIGVEALSENGDWVMLHRERPLEMPHP